MFKILNETDEKSYKKFSVAIDEKEWSAEFSKVLAKFVKRTNVPGFRPGKAPIELIRKSLNNNELYNETSRLFLNNIISELSKNLNTGETKYVEQPSDVFFEEVNDNQATFSIVYEKIPQIQMPDYKKFNIQKFSDEVKEQEVESEFNRYISKDIMLFPKEEGDVEKGDNVNIDFKGMFDKVPFPGGTGKNFDLIIGSAAFIPGFEEQLIGMKKGETKIIDVSFPSDYNEKAYAGKKAQFEVTINSISTVEKPEMNKQYFEKMKLENVNNEKEFKEYIRKQIADYKKYHNLQEFEKQFSEALIENSVVEYFPVILIAREKERIDKETDRIAKEKNMNKKEYLASVGYTEDKLYQNGLSLTAERNIKLILGIEKISDELKIVVTKEDIDDYFAKLAKLYGLTIEDVNEKYGSYIANIESFLFKQKIFSEILDKFYR